MNSDRTAQPQSSPKSTEEELRALLRRVRQIELRTKKSVNAHAQGAYHSRFKGRGMAFDESRAYVAGDDPRHVDWNVTARTGELFVKQFVEERELTLLLAIDMSGSMSFGSRSRGKRHLAAEAAALLAFSALRNNDKVGLLLFTDRVERLIRPKKGRGHVLRLLREILACEPVGQGTDLALGAQTVAHLSRQRAIVALLSDFIAPGVITDDHERPLGDIERPLKVLAKRHDLLALELEDPLERELPDVGLLSVRDPESGERGLIDTSSAAARERYRISLEMERDRVRDRLARLGVERVTLETGADSSTALVRFLRRRARGAAA